MQHKLSRRTLDISCFDDLCEPSELISGIEYRYNADGELEFLGLADNDREAVDTDFYHCIGDGKVSARIRQIQENKPKAKFAHELALKHAREAREAARLEAKARAIAEDEARKHLSKLTGILGRKPTDFEVGFYKTIEINESPLLMFELSIRDDRGYMQKYVNYAHGRAGLPTINSQYDLVVGLMRSISVHVVFCNIETKESFVEEYSFANKESVDGILRPENLAPTCWGALLMEPAKLYEISMMGKGEVITRNFQYVNALKGIWQASAHFTRTDNLVKREIEFSTVRYDGPKKLS